MVVIFTFYWDCKSLKIFYLIQYLHSTYGSRIPIEYFFKEMKYLQDRHFELKLKNGKFSDNVYQKYLSSVKMEAF